MKREREGAALECSKADDLRAVGLSAPWELASV